MRARDRTGWRAPHHRLRLVRGIIAPDGVDAALADGRTALELEPRGGETWTLAALLVGRSLVLRGDVDESTEFFEDVARGEWTNMRAYALAELSLGQLGRGDAERALAPRTSPAR